MFEGVWKKLYRYKEKYQCSPESFELNQKTYNDLYDEAIQMLKDVEIDKTKDRPKDKNATIFGIHIVINNRMKYGNWRFK